MKITKYTKDEKIVHYSAKRHGNALFTVGMGWEAVGMYIDSSRRKTRIPV